MLPIMTGTGRLTAEVELRFAPSGVGVATIPLAFNSRRKNDQTGEWEDGDVFFVRGTAFRQLAESAAETLAKGMEVVVSGRLKTDQWSDKETGANRSATSLLVDSIGPSLAFATAKVMKVERSGGQRQSAPAGEDPWGSAPPAGPPSNADDEPPF